MLLLTERCPAPHRTGQADFPASGSSAMDSGRLRVVDLIRVTLSIRFPIVEYGECWHCRSSVAVAAFTPPELPGFIAIPATIPRSRPSAGLPLLGLLRHTRAVRFQRESPTIRLVRPLSPCIARCRLRPRGGRRSLVVLHVASVACFFRQSVGPPDKSISGLPTGFSFYRFTSQPSAASLLSVSGGMTLPYPVGFPPTRQKDHFQVHV